MKLLLWIVLTIAVITADCIDNQDGPDDQISTNEFQQTSDESKDNNLEDDYQQEEKSFDDLHEIDTNILEEEERQIERMSKRSRCKARNSCVVLGGFCVTNTTHCSGRLVAEGCKPKGSNCTCCVPGTLENKLNNLEMELQFMKENITDELLNQDTKLDFIREHQDEACYSPGFSCAFGKGNCRPDSCNSTTEDQNGTCGGVGCKCCTTKICYSPGSSCASSQGTCRPNSCNSTTEDQSGTCGGASCKCCKTKNCYSHGSSCASGQGTCRANSCHSTEEQSGSCGGASCKCCKTKICHSPGSSCASGNGVCRANSCNSNEQQSGTCGGANCKCCRNCPTGSGFFVHSGQCFKFLSDSAGTWDTAKSRCGQLGFVLAKPVNPVGIRSYLLTNYGSGKFTWLGAGVVGSVVKWERDGTIIGTSNSLWSSSHGSRTTPNWHLILLVHSYDASSQPSRPYRMLSPTWSSGYALCEKLPLAG